MTDKKNFTFRISETSVQIARKAAAQNGLSLNKQVEKALEDLPWTAYSKAKKIAK